LLWHAKPSAPLVAGKTAPNFNKPQSNSCLNADELGEEGQTRFKEICADDKIGMQSIKP
jgi:hypothetical protein